MTPRRMPIVTLNWQSWSIIAVVVVLLIVLGFFVGR
jgi:hypothetical protein